MSQATIAFIPQLTLRCDSPAVAPARIERSAAGAVRLGRHADNDMVFADEQVSRRHAEIFSRGGDWILLNLSGTNPVLVDGVAQSGEFVLSRSQVLLLGNTCVLAEVGSGSADSNRRQGEEMAGLVEYLAFLESVSSAEAMVEGTLALLHRHSHATWTGFVGNDAEDMRLRAQYPETPAGGSFLSRELNKRALSEMAPVWQASAGVGGDVSESLGRVGDSLGIPLVERKGGVSRAIGVVHMYRRQGRFVERETHFAQVVARMAAFWLASDREMSALGAEVRRLAARAGAQGRIVGESPGVVEMRRRITRVAPSPMSVLIRGESGTGKELIAEAIHKASPRAGAPLVAVNCASIDPSRAESDLFGHEKGAFTGADSRHAGFFQQAHEGTLFLDELGELPMECQAKLLRALETGIIRPMKGKERVVDVRLIAATNRDLLAEVAAGRFREDLYYRIASVVIEAPPLRERGGDIALLARLFLEGFSAQGHRATRLGQRAIEAMQAYAWPGNIRQLRSVVEAAFHLAEAEEIGAEHLHLPKFPAGAASEDDCNLENTERRAMARALEKTSGNLTKAAELLGIHRETLGIKARKHGLLPPG
jgi:DNA-binding NtrC family response regulator